MQYFRIEVVVDDSIFAHLIDLERDIQVLYRYFCKYVLINLFLVLTLFGIKVHLEDVTRLFGVQSWSLHTAKSGVNRDAFSQNIKTVSNWWNTREASKSSSHFLSADQSLSLVIFFSRSRK